MPDPGYNSREGAQLPGGKKKKTDDFLSISNNRNTHTHAGLPRANVSICIFQQLACHRVLTGRSCLDINVASDLYDCAPQNWTFDLPSEDDTRFRTVEFFRSYRRHHGVACYVLEKISQARLSLTVTQPDIHQRTEKSFTTHCLTGCRCKTKMMT